VGDRDVHGLWIRQRGVAIGHRPLRRLDGEMDPARVAHPIRPESVRAGRIERLEDVEHLERDDARGVRRVRRHTQAAI